jgi:hypothetical protein
MSDAEVIQLKDRWGLVDPVTQMAFDKAFDDLRIESAAELSHIVWNAVNMYTRYLSLHKENALAYEALMNIIKEMDDE